MSAWTDSARVDEIQETFRIFATLSRESRRSAADYMRFLAHTESLQRARQMEEGAAAIREIVSDDIPWASEEEMIAELADFRRNRTEK